MTMASSNRCIRLVLLFTVLLNEAPVSLPQNATTTTNLVDLSNVTTSVTTTSSAQTTGSSLPPCDYCEQYYVDGYEWYKNAFSAQLVAKFCTPDTNFPNNIGPTFTYLEQCEFWAAQSAALTPWVANNIAMPMWVYYSRWYVLNSQLLDNSSYMPNQSFLHPELIPRELWAVGICMNWSMYALYNALFTALWIFVATPTYILQTQAVWSPATLALKYTLVSLQVLYFPVVIFSFYATVSILRRIARAENEFHSVAFFYAEAAGQLLSYVFTLVNKVFVFFPLILPFCFMSPTAAINTQNIAWDNISSIGPLCFIPSLFAWCYQSIMHTTVALDRCLAIYAPIWYSHHMNATNVRVWVACLTFAFVLVCCAFMAGVLFDGAFIGSGPNFMQMFYGEGQSVWDAMALWQLTFALIFLGIPLVLYAILSAALALTLCKKLNAKKNNAGHKSVRGITVMVLSVFAINVIPCVFELASVALVVVCPMQWSCTPTVASNGVQNTTPFLVEFSSVACLITQCFCSRIFRESAKDFWKATWVGRCVLALRSRLCPGCLAATAVQTQSGGTVSTSVSNRGQGQKGVSATGAILPDGAGPAAGLPGAAVEVVDID